MKTKYYSYYGRWQSHDDFFFEHDDYEKMDDDFSNFVWIIVITIDDIMALIRRTNRGLWSLKILLANWKTVCTWHVCFWRQIQKLNYDIWQKYKADIAKLYRRCETNKTPSVIHVTLKRHNYEQKIDTVFQRPRDVHERHRLLLLLRRRIANPCYILQYS